MRPSSGCSTRSRRDEVWEIKRKRWLARQKNGGYNGDAVGNGGGNSRKPPAMSIATDAPPRAGSDMQRGAAPGSPLSRLVASGYPETTQGSATTHQPYGDRPPSGGGGAGAGFNGAVAGQWNSNVQQSLQNRQALKDPNVAGPHIPQGGQRVTQAPGGVASIDLSFASGGGGGAAPARTPPRMPGAGQQQQQQQQSYGQQQQAAAAYQQQQAYGNGQQQQSYNGHAGAAGGQMRAPSPARGGGGGGRSAAPWGSDDNYIVTPSRAAQRQRESCPFGQDSLAAAGPPVGARRGQAGPGGGIGAHANGFEAGGPPAGGQMGQRGSRGSSPHHSAVGSHAAFPISAGAGGPAGAAHNMGGRYGRPPGGGSSLVLG